MSELPADYVKPVVISKGRVTNRRKIPDYDWRADPQVDPEYVEQLDIGYMLDQLHPRQVTYCIARLRGATLAEACVNLGILQFGGEAWETSPWWEPLCDRERFKLFGDPGKVFMPMVPQAVAVVRDALAGKHGPKFAHAAADTVFDRVYGKPTQTQVNKRDPEDDGGSLAADIVQILKATAEVVGQALPGDSKALPHEAEEGERAEVVEVQSTVVV